MDKIVTTLVTLKKRFEGIFCPILAAIFHLIFKWKINHGYFCMRDTVFLRRCYYELIHMEWVEELPQQDRWATIKVFRDMLFIEYISEYERRCVI